MKKMPLTLLCAVTLLVAASMAFAADAKKEKKEMKAPAAAAAPAASAPDMHHRGRPYVLHGNQGFHYGDHLNRYTMQSNGTPKDK